MIYCIYIQYAVPTQLQQDTSWWPSLLMGGPASCLIHVLVELNLGWKGGYNASH